MLRIGTARSQKRRQTPLRGIMASPVRNVKLNRGGALLRLGELWARVRPLCDRPTPFARRAPCSRSVRLGLGVPTRALRWLGEAGACVMKALELRSALCPTKCGLIYAARSVKTGCRPEWPRAPEFAKAPAKLCWTLVCTERPANEGCRFAAVWRRQSVCPEFAKAPAKPAPVDHAAGCFYNRSNRPK